MVLLTTAVVGLIGLNYFDAKHSILEDLIKVKGLIEVKNSIKKSNKLDKNSIYYSFLSIVNSSSKRNEVCYICEGIKLTWNQVNEQVNRFSNFLLSKGIRRGDAIALFMDNKPNFIIIWLACLAIDSLPAFINYNLVQEGLTHCVKVSKAVLLIYDSTFTSQIEDAVPLLFASLPNLKYVDWTDQFSTPPSPSSHPSSSSSSTQFEEKKENDVIHLSPSKLLIYSSNPIPDSRRSGITLKDPAFLIYTSGSTGLPKPAICTHGKVKTGMIMFSRLNGFNKKTRIYTPMPLYHSTAAILAIAVSWHVGSTVIIGRKFSATKYWEEVRKYDANVIQYVGEVLRYLLAVPPTSLDRDHKVKLAYGNGANGAVWEKFRDRFGVDTISEFFASTEGNGSLFNKNSNLLGAGAVGHEGTLSTYVRRNDQAIVKVDPLTEEPERNAEGFCIRAAPNENGELLCRIVKASPFQDFAGYYANENATAKKILKNVFVPNDTYFRTGDLLRRTKEGYYYFGDRLGDTFRWKGENVSTTQVSQILSTILTQEPNVYGVLLPGHEGRVGCVALPGGVESVDFEMVEKEVVEKLPSYARPMFLRFIEGELETTGTMKQLKVKLRNEGVDPDVVKDPVYWLMTGKYVPFRRIDWESLKGGKLRL